MVCGRFRAFSPAQRAAVPSILAGETVLVSAPTGTGKTLTAFLSVFDHLIRLKDDGRLPDGIVAVYVSPLRALAYDIQKNLNGPLEELGWDFVRVATRTGDTSSADRASQKRKPPHILVTTPESLTLMLSQPAWIAAFRSTRYFIVDELHALAENKRGALLMVAAERLEEIAAGRITAVERPDVEGRITREELKRMADRPAEENPSPPDPNEAPAEYVSRVEHAKAFGLNWPIHAAGASADPEPPHLRRSRFQRPRRAVSLGAIAAAKSDGESVSPDAQGLRVLVRIGLSATMSPLETVAQFLGGVGSRVRIIEIPRYKKAKIELFSPLRENPYPPAGWTATRVLKELGALVAQKRTTLIFTNTRSGAETIGVRLKQLWPKEADRIEVHHASLDRAIRLDVEDRLKRGELRAVVCSTSLEMGIDIGAIDTVVMISAPKGVSRALQRVGRSGHSLSETSHGVLVASNVNDLVECTVTVRLMEEGVLEPVRIQANPLDVLAQHLVGLALFETMTPDEAFALIRRAYSFATLTRAMFDRVLRYLEGGGTSLERAYRDVFGKVEVVDGILRIPSNRVARDFYQNVGTISSETMIQVRLGRRNLGQVEDTFINRLKEGDVFVLNGRCLRFLGLRLLTARVAEANSLLPTVPRWNANKMPLTSNVAEAVVKLRTDLSARLQHPETIVPWLQREYALSAVNAAAMEQHFRLQAEVSRVPTSDFFLVEAYREENELHYFFHSLIGRSANDALSRIVAWRVSRARGGNALVTIDDYGFLLSVKPFQAMDLAALQRLFSPEGAEEALREALSEANLVKWHFRNTAQTGLMVPRRTSGRERGAKAMQFSSEIIFDVLRRYEPDHPLLVEAYNEATLRFLDTPRALAFLETIQTLPWDFRELDKVSPFSFGIFVSKIKETMTLEDPETTIERLFNQMYGSQVPASD